MFGLTWEKLLLIAVIAGMLIGPERLPRYAEGLARLTVKARDWVSGAKTRVQEEMGEGLDDVDWRKLDPRQYDPRRIIREALLDDAPTTTVRAAATGAAMTTAAAPATPPLQRPDGPPPFDSEAT